MYIHTTVHEVYMYILRFRFNLLQDLKISKSLWEEQIQWRKVEDATGEKDGRVLNSCEWSPSSYPYFRTKQT